MKRNCSHRQPTDNQREVKDQSESLELPTGCRPSLRTKLDFNSYFQVRCSVKLHEGLSIDCTLWLQEGAERWTPPCADDSGAVNEVTNGIYCRYLLVVVRVDLIIPPRREKPGRRRTGSPSRDIHRRYPGPYPVSRRTAINPETNQ